jgi:hypothetical protein
MTMWSVAKARQRRTRTPIDKPPGTNSSMTSMGKVKKRIMKCRSHSVPKSSRCLRSTGLTLYIRRTEM